MTIANPVQETNFTDLDRADLEKVNGGYYTVDMNFNYPAKELHIARISRITAANWALTGDPDGLLGKLKLASR
jgi:hypothetical protein